MMKRIIILLCMLMVACPIKGADSSASSSQGRLGVAITYEPLEVDSSDDKGKEEEEIVGMVHLKREGHEIVPPFAIALLDRCHAGVLMTAAGRFVQDDKEAWIRSIFQDYTDNEIRLFIGALEHNSEDDASAWVDGLSNDDCISLIAIANCWDIKHIMQVCQERLARDITDTDADALPGDVQCLLKDQFKQDLPDLNWYILKRLSFPSRDCWLPKVDVWTLRASHIRNDNKLVFYTKIWIIAYDFTAQTYEKIFIADDYDNETIKAVHSCEDENKLLIITGKRVLLYDFTAQTYKSIFIRQDMRVRGELRVCLCKDENKLFIADNDDGPFVTSYDVATGEYKITRCLKFERFILYDFATGESKMIHYPKFVRSVHYVSGGVLIESGDEILFYDIKKDTIRKLCSPHVCKFSCTLLRAEGKKVAIAKSVLMELSDHDEMIESVCEILHGNGRCLIQTSRRIIVCNVTEGIYKDIFVVADNQRIRSIEKRSLTQDGKHIVIRVVEDIDDYHIYRVILCDIDTCSHTEISDKGWYRDEAYYNVDESGIIIKRYEDILLYDLETKMINTLFTGGCMENHCLIEQHDSYEGVLLKKGDQKVCIHRFQENCSQDIFTSYYGDPIRSVEYDEQTILIHTLKRIVIIPIPISSSQYEQLSLQQLQLLSRALPSWKLDKPYELAVDEFDLYKSLPKNLQSKQLFSTYYVDINDNPMNPSMFMGDVTYGQAVKCQVM